MLFGPKITVGEFEVLSSGVVIVPAGKQVELFPTPHDQDPFRVIITFETVSGVPHGIDGKTEGTKILRIKLTNFDNPLGTVTTQPVEIGTSGARKLFLALAASAIGNEPEGRVRLLTYSFMFGPE